MGSFALETTPSPLPPMGGYEFHNFDMIFLGSVIMCLGFIFSK